MRSHSTEKATSDDAVPFGRGNISSSMDFIGTTTLSGSGQVNVKKKALHV